MCYPNGGFTMQDIKHSLIQENNKENKSDEFDFGNVSEIHDLRFKIEWGKTQFFSLIIAIIYAISLIILGLSLISVPTAISIYITLFVLVVAPISIALYCKKQQAQEYKKDYKSKIFSNEVMEEINSPDLYFYCMEDKQDYYLTRKIGKNIKPILKIAICFFIFAFIGVAVNLIFLQTIFTYIALAIQAIIIFSVGYKMHKTNSCLKKSDDIKYNDDKKMPEINIESQDKESMSEDIELEKNDIDLPWDYLL